MPTPERLKPSFYFTNLSIENVRAFGEKQELQLADKEGRPAKWTLIVGDNGVGKTTLLQCLAWMRPKFNPPPDDSGGSPGNRGEPAPRPIEPELAAEEDNEVLAALVRSGNETTARLEARLSDGIALGPQNDGRPIRLSTSFSLKRADGRITNVKADGRITNVKAGEAAADAEAANDVDVNDVEEPLVLGYGAGRHPTVGAEMNAVATGPVESLFAVAARLRDAEELLHRLRYWKLTNVPGAAAQLDSMKKAIAAMLPDVGSAQGIEIDPSRAQSDPSRRRVHVRTPYGSVPLDQVSLGYRTVFAWTVDIAWRLIEHYPDSPNPLREPAIVLVDEIDLHLHPRWQRKIRETLAAHFPRVQFIATAHSPLMAQSSLDANVAVVRRSGGHAEIVNDPVLISAWRLDQLVTSDLFGLDSARSPAVERQQRRRAELLEKPELSPAERAELDALDQQALGMPTAELHADNEAMAIIRQAADRLRSRGETS